MLGFHVILKPKRLKLDVDATLVQFGNFEQQQFFIPLRIAGPSIVD